MGGLADLRSSLGSYVESVSGLAFGDINKAAADFESIIKAEIRSAPIPAGVKNAVENGISANINVTSGTAVISLSAMRPSIFNEWYGGSSWYGDANISAIYNFGAVITKSKLQHIPGFNIHPAGNYIEKAIDKFNSKYTGSFHANLT